MTNSVDRRNTWSDAEVAQLRELVVDETKSYAEIARLMGMTKEAVNGKLKRLGLAARGTPIKPLANKPEAPKRAGAITLPALTFGGDVLKAAVVAAWHERDPMVSVVQIAARLGVSKGVVCGIVHRAKLPKRPYFARPGNPKRPTTVRRDPKPVKLPEVPVMREPCVAPPPPLALLPELRMARSCLYTAGERGRWLFCDEPTVDGSQWCAAHRKACTVAMPSRRVDQATA